MDLERVRPLRDLVLVRRDKMLSQTEGGLWAPEHWGDGVHPWAYQRARALNESNLKAKYRLSGVVVACGPGGYGKTGARVPMQLERGMRVLFLDEGEDVDMDDEHEYVMLAERHCIAEELAGEAKPERDPWQLFGDGLDAIQRDHDELNAPVIAEFNRRTQGRGE